MGNLLHAVSSPAIFPLSETSKLAASILASLSPSTSLVRRCKFIDELMAAGGDCVLLCSLDRLFLLNSGVSELLSLPSREYGLVKFELADFVDELRWKFGCNEEEFEEK